MLPVPKLIHYIELCDTLAQHALLKRALLTQLLSCIYADPKDKLTSHRHLYVFQEADYDDPVVNSIANNWRRHPDYHEDPIYECHQNDILVFLTKAIEKIIVMVQYNDPKEKPLLTQYFYDCILPFA